MSLATAVPGTRVSPVPEKSPASPAVIRSLIMTPIERAKRGKKFFDNICRISVYIDLNEILFTAFCTRYRKYSFCSAGALFLFCATTYDVPRVGTPVHCVDFGEMTTKGSSRPHLNSSYGLDTGCHLRQWRVGHCFPCLLPIVQHTRQRHHQVVLATCFENEHQPKW